MLQDDYYLNIEADAFFERWYSKNSSFKGELRDSKKDILLKLEQENLFSKKIKVLEVGCFVGDLLNHLKKKFKSDVYGIEASAKACAMSKKLYDLNLENNSFISSSFFHLSPENHKFFDLIIFDDVLSWMSRDNILQVLAVTDWMLKEGGSIFLRDFSPSVSFAYENHHQKGKNIFNFKQSNGHRQFFLQSGMYIEKSTNIYVEKNLQSVSTLRDDSSIWADTILTKCYQPLHPVLNL